MGLTALSRTHLVQVRQLLQEVEHMQERNMQLQQQQQPPSAAGSGSNGSSSQAIEPAAVLLCGDLNTTPDSETVRVSFARGGMRHSRFQSPLCRALLTVKAFIAWVAHRAACSTAGVLSAVQWADDSVSDAVSYPACQQRTARLLAVFIYRLSRNMSWA